MPCPLCSVLLCCPPPPGAHLAAVLDAYKAHVLLLRRLETPPPGAHLAVVVDAQEVHVLHDEVHPGEERHPVGEPAGEGVQETEGDHEGGVVGHADGSLATAGGRARWEERGEEVRGCDRQGALPGTLFGPFHSDNVRLHS